MKRPVDKFGTDAESQSSYIAGTLDDMLQNAYASAYDDGFVEVPKPAPQAAQTESVKAKPRKTAKKKFSKKQLTAEAQTKIESILNLRTFFVVGSTTIMLVFYIYNVISINKLAGESETVRKKLEEVKSLNTVLESRLQNAWQFEELSQAAKEELGLKISSKLPVVLETE